MIDLDSLDPADLTRAAADLIGMALVADDAGRDRLATAYRGLAAELARIADERSHPTPEPDIFT